MNFKCTKSSKSVVQSFFLLFFANARADRNRRNDFSKTLGVEIIQWSLSKKFLFIIETDCYVSTLVDVAKSFEVQVNKVKYWASHTAFDFTHREEPEKHSYKINITQKAIDGLEQCIRVAFLINIPFGSNLFGKMQI